jgi:hypothetical protein
LQRGLGSKHNNNGRANGKLLGLMAKLEHLGFILKEYGNEVNLNVEFWEMKAIHVIKKR